MILRAEKMERGRGQILQRYRPDETFDHESHFIARVVEYRPDRTYDEELDRARMIEEAMRLVRRWRTNGRLGRFARPDAAPTFPPDTAAASSYDVIVPGGLSFSYYPLTVTCKNPQCRRAYVLQRVPEPGQEIETCPNCHSEPSYQLQYLLVHGCGYAKPFEPPRQCDNGCQRGFRLDTQASRFRDFRWICLRCGAAKELTSFCDNQLCTFPSTAKMMQPEVHTSGQAYVPTTVLVVNPASAAERRTNQTVEYRLGVVGHWLGVCSDAEFDSLRSGRSREMDPALREAIETIRELDPARASELERKHSPLDVERLRERISDRMGGAALDDSAIASLSGQLETYHRTVRDAINLEALSRDAASESRRILYESYPAVLREAGLDPQGMALVPDFPVIELAIGYSRGGYTAQEADLRSYRGAQARGQAGRTLLYAHPQRTEALVLRLDTSRVARWLHANRLVSHEETGGAQGILNWFARYLARRNDELAWIEFESDPPAEDRAGDALVRLMHSMAHQFIRALSVDSGFMETSLSEHFFPYHLSFAIYPRANGEFVIGGLRTVIEQNLDEVVRRALDSDTCLYDPNCILANRGADHGCLFLPETACSFRNRNSHLSRWELFGSPHGDYVGYWDTQLDS